MKTQDTEWEALIDEYLNQSQRENRYAVISHQKTGKTWYCVSEEINLSWEEFSNRIQNWNPGNGTHRLEVGTSYVNHKQGGKTWNYCGYIESNNGTLTRHCRFPGLYPEITTLLNAPQCP